MRMDKELFDAYVQDINILINDMDHILKKRNSVGTLDSESVDTLFRIFHTIKASALVLEDSKAADISYKMENIISYLRKHGPDALNPQSVISLMFDSEYFFRSRLGVMIKSSPDESTKEFEGQLDQMVSTINSDSSFPTTHMIPFEYYKPMFENIIAEMSGVLGKKAELQFEGEQLFIDRQIIIQLSGPLTQIIRNAMDHGIETPAERIKRGKPETGVITVTYGIEDGIMFITVYNDGETINLKKILRRADKLHMLKKPRDAYKADEIVSLIMERGFTTTEKPNKYSGRGVGMDVIKSTAKDMGGAIFINTGLTDGFSITFTFPIDEQSKKAAIVKQTKGGETCE